MYNSFMVEIAFLLLKNYNTIFYSLNFFTAKFKFIFTILSGYDPAYASESVNIQYSTYFYLFHISDTFSHIEVSRQRQSK